MIPALIGAIGGLAATALGSSLQSRANRNAWIEQNEYNSPKAQIARLRDAGVNPASVLYGNKTIENVSGTLTPPDFPSALSAASQHAVNALSMSNLKEQNKNLKAQNKVLEADARGKEIANTVAAAESKEAIARAESFYDYGSEYVDLPKPDANPDLDWFVDSKDDIWKFKDDNGFLHVSNPTDWIDFDSRFKANVRRRQLIDYDYRQREWNVNATMIKSKLDAIETAIKEVYGSDIAQKTIDHLQAMVNNLDENTKAISFDNSVFENLGVGSKIADGIIRLLVGVLKRF